MNDYPKQDLPPPTYNQIGFINQDTDKTNNYVGGQPASSQQIYVAQPIAQPSQVIIVPNMVFGDNPVGTTCPNCKANIFTQTKHESGAVTWLIAGGLVLIGCWLGCCLIPFCVDSCKDVEHYCPNCRALLGRHKKL